MGSTPRGGCTAFGDFRGGGACSVEDDDDGDGHSPNEGDCNDLYANRFPGAFKACTGTDTCSITLQSQVRAKMHEGRPPDGIELFFFDVADGNLVDVTLDCTGPEGS